jgi:hypothetical protein
MRTKDLIGKKIKGFYYRPNKKRHYTHTKEMEVNIGKVGVVHQVGMCGKVVFIRFKGFPLDLAYPLRLAKKHIINL